MASKYTTIACWGAAHSNAHIDNCMLCAPLWGQVVVPVGITSADEFHALLETMTPAQKKSLKIGRNRAAFNLSKKNRDARNDRMMAERDARIAAKMGGVS